MTGKSFKQGYTCERCVNIGYAPVREEALYRRTNEGMKFIGMVLCRTHGIQNAIKLSEVG